MNMVFFLGIILKILWYLIIGNFLLFAFNLFLEQIFITSFSDRFQRFDKNKKNKQTKVNL